MESESELGPGRYRFYLIFSVVLALLTIGVGIWGIGWSNEPFLGWFMLAVGIVTTVIAVVQARRA
ncbi:MULTISPECIES: hypothetical protein [unclassified Microbacterium]|uniref:hypothetical protein n=1 Tax=unclassified Microbacterium TaxID=2609290 RepID=UPI00301B2BFA